LAASLLGQLARLFDDGVVILNLSSDAGDVMLDALSKMLDAGVLEILSDGQQVLARLRLASPAAAAAADGQLELSPITEERCRAEFRNCRLRAPAHAKWRRSTFM
jgi:hypothetical protein